MSEGSGHISETKRWEPSKEFLAEFFRLRRLEEARKRLLKERAWKKAKAVADHLKKKWGVKSVYLYGSLAWGTFHERSDIDIMAVGFTGNYWRMLVEVEEIALPFECTVVCEEDAFPSLRAKVLSEGVEL
ncbi:MAG TPA: nucleotidyltransferase domain-containing protein [Syntrophomonadaceae bacterium]|nr:nucleotidyltransferase domain-containing protein [Syntrophomonadaceae bacterium]